MQIGLVGLGKMGGNMRERLRNAGHTVIGYDTNPEKSPTPAAWPDLVNQLEAPRTVWVMVPAGEATQSTSSTSWGASSSPTTSWSTAATPAGRTTRSTPRS
ncbi:hypothetical protein SPURM210S_08385 [Streptomyces purpurascens]